MNSNKVIADAVAHEIALVVSQLSSEQATVPLAELCDTLMKSLTLALAHMAVGNRDGMKAMIAATANAMTAQAETRCLEIAAKNTSLAAEWRSVMASDEAVP
jgi:hypothetical protein